MTMRRAMRQMSASAERSGKGQGEALSAPDSDEASRPRHEAADTGAGLLFVVLARENMQQAWKRVRSNKGAAGIDGLGIDDSGGASGVGVATSARTTGVWDIPASAGAPGNDPEAGRRPARAGYPSEQSNPRLRPRVSGYPALFPKGFREAFPGRRHQYTRA